MRKGRNRNSIFYSTISFGHMIFYIFSGTCANGVCYGSNDLQLQVSSNIPIWISTSTIFDLNAAYCFSREAAIAWDWTNKNDIYRQQRPALY